MTSPHTTIAIDGIPFPYSRPGVSTRGGFPRFYHGKRLRTWLEEVRRQAQDRIPSGYAEPADHVAEVLLVFRPGMTKEGKPRKRTGDVDNLAKAILDGLQGVCWEDDKVVSALTSIIAGASTEPGLEVHIRWWPRTEWSIIAGVAATHAFRRLASDGYAAAVDAADRLCASGAG